MRPYPILKITAVCLFSLNAIAVTSTQTCESLFSTIRSKLPPNLMALAASSPSKMIPQNRMVRDAVEFGRNGLYLITPSNDRWLKNPDDPNAVNVKLKKPTESMPEGVAYFKGKFTANNKKPLVAYPENMIVGREQNVDSLLEHATSIKLRVSSTNPDQIHQLVFANYAEQPTALVFSFKAPKTPTDIEIPIPSGAELKNYNFLFLKWNKENKENVDLNIYGSLVFERDILKKESQAMELVESLLGYKQVYGYNSLLKIAFKNMQNPALLESAITASQKDIKTQVKKLGIDREVIFKDKVSVQEFFLGPLFFKRYEGGPAVPIEAGDFAHEHSSDVHSRQLIVMTHGMTARQKENFIENIYGNLFGAFAEGWRAWDLMFDAPGDSTPFSPQWWRFQRELRGLKVL